MAAKVSGGKLIERRGLQSELTKLNIPRQNYNCISNESTSNSGSNIQGLGGNSSSGSLLKHKKSSSLTSLLQAETGPLPAPQSQRRPSIDSSNSLLDDKSTADRKSLTALFALMDKLSQEITDDLSH